VVCRVLMKPSRDRARQNDRAQARLSYPSCCSGSNIRSSSDSKVSGTLVFEKAGAGRDRVSRRGGPGAPKGNSAEKASTPATTGSGSLSRGGGCTTTTSTRGQVSRARDDHDGSCAHRMVLFLLQRGIKAFTTPRASASPSLRTRSSGQGGSVGRGSKRTITAKRTERS
jgi:hypothetical protein